MKTLKVLLPAFVTATILPAAAARADITYEEVPVLSSTPIYHVVESSRPERQCWEEEVVREARSTAPSRSATPGILGAVIGGAVGNAVGSRKRNQQVGTVVGAILGGSIARDIVYNREQGRTVEYIDTVERCRTVHTSYQEEKLVGYDVRYSYNGQENSVRLPQDPGATMRVRVNVEPVF
ncbi:MAG: glycine zipper 2TM domain-containing protein [Pseudohongiellaceae bacterium]